MSAAALGIGAREVAPATGLRRTWALALLTIIYGFNQLDRGIVAILLESIKSEMHLSDTQLGLMTGLGFSLIYALCSLPLGRLADRTRRVPIIAIGAIFYSLAAAMTGLAQTITQLLVARSTVAVGEASSTAPSSSMVADLYPPATRTRAIAIWSGGSYIGIFAGLALGGWLNAHYGWRVALWATALPGALCGAVLLFTVAEPPRGMNEKVRVDDPHLPLGVTLHALFSRASYRWLFCALTLAAVTAYSFQVWVPSLLTRVHHLGKADVGFYAGFFKGLLGWVGIIGGGIATDRIGKGRPRLMPVVPIAVSLCCVPALLLFLLADGTAVSLVALGIGSVFISAYQAASMTMIHAVTRPRMRTFAVTIAFAGVSIGGLGLGPLIVGSLSDLLQHRFGADSLRYALIVPALVPLATAFCFYRVRTSIDADAALMLAGPEAVR